MTEILEHSPECKERWKQYEVAKDADYCWTCEGTGEVLGEPYDPSPAGVSLSRGTMQDLEPCPNCSDKNRCARCGKSLGDESVCKDCGFDQENPGKEMNPPEDIDCSACEQEVPRI